VIVVGSGPAGLAAADILAGHRLDVLVLDDNAHPGGQLLRRHLSGPPARRFEPDQLKRRGRRLIRRLKGGPVRLVSGAQVLGIFPERTLLVADCQGCIREYRTDTLIMATGARERQLPFAGWTLPGVMAAGAAQILMKSSGVLPGRTTMIGGCGPLIFLLAAQILTQGGHVRAVMDQTKAAAKLAAVTAGPAIWPKLLEGVFSLTRLIAARVPVQQGVRIVAARGRRYLESVVVAHVDARGRILQGTEMIYPSDSLAVGYGFVPNIELPQQAGCSISHDVDKGGWIVDVNPCMATSVPGVYAAGETTGIAGAAKSLVEGQLAAWDILCRRGKVNRNGCDRLMRSLQHRRNRQVQFGRFLNRLCCLNPDCYADISDETIICRCEEITMGEIRRQLGNGFTTLNGIKKATRCGMGDCQGRICGPLVTDIVSAYTHRPAYLAGCTSPRAPVRPVSLGALADMETIGGDGSEGGDHL